MGLGLKQGVGRYFRSNIGALMFVVILFTTGIVFGALMVNVLDGQQRLELTKYLEVFFKDVHLQEKTLNSLVLQKSLFENIRILAAVWILGLTVIGIPVVWVIIFLRGFIIGFTVGFLVEEMAIKGMLFAVISLLPHNIILLPAFLVATVTAMAFSVNIIKNKFFAKKPTPMKEFFSYTLQIGFLGALIVCGVFIEAYITPLLMKFFMSYFV